MASLRVLYLPSSEAQLMTGSRQEACRNPHLDPQTHSLLLPFLPCGLMSHLNFFFISFSEMKMMVRGSLRVGGGDVGETHGQRTSQKRPRWWGSRREKTLGTVRRYS